LALQPSAFEEGPWRVPALAPHLPAALTGRLNYSRGGAAPKNIPAQA